MRYKYPLKLNRQKSLYLVCFAALLLLSPGVGVWAGNSISKNITPDSWPTSLDKRELYSFRHAFVYAGSKSDTVEVNRRIETAIKELDKDGI